MSPKLLFALLSFLVANTAAAPASGHGACVLLKNTAVEQFQLSTLTPLFGELLTTESNGNIYYVSVCSPIPRTFYDPRKLAGAVKLTADGTSIELGRIDLSNVVVNENDIVLTYDGGDVDKNPKDTCKGLRWNTYVSFTCDPYTNKDILTLTDEDPNQPEICQVWFEIRTRKICDRRPSITLHSLEKDLSNEEKEIRKKEESERNRIYNNEILSKNKPSNTESGQIVPHKISPKSKIEGKESNQTDFKNYSPDHQPSIYVKPNFINEQESMSRRENENKLNQHFLPKIHPFHNENNDSVEKYEKTNEEFESGHSTLTKPKDHLSINKNPSDYNSETNPERIKPEDDQLRNKNENIVETEKSMSFENKSTDETQFILKHPVSKNNVPRENENEEKSWSKNHEFSVNTYENPRYENKMYVHKEDYLNKNLPVEKLFNNKHYDFEINKNDNPNQFIPNNPSSTNKEPSDKSNTQDHSNEINKSSADVNKNGDEENKIKISPEETSLRNDPNPRYENKIYVHQEDYLNKNIPEKKWSQIEVPSDKTNINDNSNQKSKSSEDVNTNSEEDKKIKISPEETFSRNEPNPRYENKIYVHQEDYSNKNLPEKKWSQTEVPSDRTNIKDNSNQKSKSSEDVNTNPEEDKKIKTSPEEIFPRNQSNPWDANKMYVHQKDYSNKNLSEEKSSNNNHFDSKTNKNDDSTQFIPNNMSSKNKIPSDNTQYHNTNVKDNSDQRSKSSEDVNTNSEGENKMKRSHEETSSRNENQKYISNQNTPKSKYFNEEHDSLNNSLENKPSNNENNNSNYKYPANEKNETNRSNYKKSHTNELNNSSNNMKPLDDEKELKQNSTSNSNLENEHLKTFNSTINGIKPNMNSNSVNSQKNKSEDSLSKKNIENPDNTNNQLKSADNTSIKNNETTVENKTESTLENVSKSYDNATVNGEVNTNGSTVTPPENSQSNTTITYHPNKSSEVNNTENVKTPVDESKTNKNDNGNQINSVTKNTETTESPEQNLNKNSQDSVEVPNSSNESSKTTDDSQPESSFSFGSLYSKLFPNGIKLSMATIIFGVLGFLPAVYLAVNRFYYKKSCTDQIPFKGVFTSIFIFIKSFLSKIFCGCCGEKALGTSNEKTPLLNPKKIVEPMVENERKKRNIDEGTYNRSNNSDGDDNSGQTNKDGYGSMSHEEPSPIFGSPDITKKRNLKDKDVIDSSDAENVMKTELNLKGKSAKDSGERKLSSVFKSKIIPAVKNIFERTGKNFDIIGTEKKEITKFAEKNVESQLNESQKRKLADIERGVEKAVENVEKVISTNTLPNENESADISSSEKKSGDDERKITAKTVTTGLSESARKNSKSKIVEKEGKDEVKNESNNLFQFVNPSVVSKTNEAKQKFFAKVGNKDDHGGKDKRNEDDSTTEYVEEIVYVDGANGDQGDEEIIEEIVETTTTPDSPSGHGVTVTKTTRKVSSSAKPGVVETSEEKVVTDDRDDGGKTRKRSFGLKLGIGKSGVNVSVGEKKMGLGLSGVKFGKKLDDSAESDAMSVAVDGSGLKVSHGQRSDPSVKGSKTNEAKQRFFATGSSEDGRGGKDKREKDDSTTEYVEEIVYVDGADGDQDGEEIVEEIVETTKTPDSPSGHGVTVTKTTRKVSSSAKPGVVETSEDTVVTDDRDDGGKTRKRSFGLKLGIGKSGVNVSVGEKKMGLGLSGVKFGKKLDDSAESDAMSIAVDGSGLKVSHGQRSDASSDGSGAVSPPKKTPKLKTKAALPNFKLFKRSTSQPADASEATDVFPQTMPESSATIPRKTSRGSAGLLIFGKSRSRSTGFLETDDSGDAAVTDVNVLSSFIDHERSASLQQLNRSASVQSLPGADDSNLPVHFPEKSSARLEDLDVKKTAVDPPKSTKRAKKKSDGEKKSTKTSKK